MGREFANVPKQYEFVLKNSHASDLHSVESYYGLSQAIQKEFRLRGEPIPPVRMIQLAPAPYWNNVKGGLYVIFRYLRTLARSNISENPIASIIARLLSMQVDNAAVAFRLHRARKQLILQSLEEFESSHENMLLCATGLRIRNRYVHLHASGLESGFMNAGLERQKTWI